MLGRPGLASTPSLVTIMPVWWDLHQNWEEKLPDSWTCGTSREGQASWWLSPHSILCPLHTWPANTCKCSRSSVTHLSEPESSWAGWVNNLGLTTGLESGQRAASGNDLWHIVPGVISTKQELEVNWSLRHPPGLCYWEKKKTNQKRLLACSVCVGKLYFWCLKCSVLCEWRRRIWKLGLVFPFCLQGEWNKAAHADARTATWKSQYSTAKPRAGKTHRSRKESGVWDRRRRSVRFCFTAHLRFLTTVWGKPCLSCA